MNCYQEVDCTKIEMGILIRGYKLESQIVKKDLSNQNKHAMWRYLAL